MTKNEVKKELELWAKDNNIDISLSIPAVHLYQT